MFDRITTITLTRQNVRACMLNGGGYFIEQRRLPGSDPSEIRWVDNAVGRVVAIDNYIAALTIATKDDLYRTNT